MDKAVDARNMNANDEASEKYSFEKDVTAVCKAYDEVPLSSLPLDMRIMVRDEQGRPRRLSPEEARRENARVLVVRESAYEKELARAKEALHRIFANIWEENNTVSLQNNSQNRAVLSNMVNMKQSAIALVSRGLKATVGGYLKMRALASDKDVEKAETSLRILGFDVCGALEKNQILKPKTAKDAEIVDMVFAYQESQPLSMITKSFGVGSITKLLRAKNANAKKMVRS